jgi:hypothetical protein
MSPKEPGKLTEIQTKTRNVFAKHHSEEYNFSQAIQDVNIEEPPVVCADVSNSQDFVGSASGAFSSDQRAPVYVSPRSEDLVSGKKDVILPSELAQGLGWRFTTAFLNIIELKNRFMMEKLEPFKTAWEKNYDGRRIFLTKKGYLGTGPASTMVKDKIMLIEGSYVPYIFRNAREEDNDSIYSLRGEGEESSRNPSKAKAQNFAQKVNGLDTGTKNRGPELAETYWRLVGEAYVHGIMHGEAFSRESQSVETIHVI